MSPTEWCKANDYTPEEIAERLADLEKIGLVFSVADSEGRLMYYPVRATLGGLLDDIEGVQR